MYGDPDERNPLWGEDWQQIRDLFPQEPGYAHLNHGSFGVAPTPVMKVQAEWRQRMEANATRFFRRELAPALETARLSVAGHLGADPDGLTLVANVTTAVAAVMTAFPLAADDEVLVTDHGYGANFMAIDRACKDAGARIVVVPVPLVSSAEEVTAAVLSHVTARTRLAVIDHITSPTARRFPVERLVPELRERGVAVFVDAAHVPGMLPVDLEALAPDFWTGNLHKWAFAPRAVAGLYAGPRWRHVMRPLVVSWRVGEGYPYSFLQYGTADLTAAVAAPTGWELLKEIGFDRIAAHNAALVAYGQSALASALGVDAASLPEDEGLAMRVVPLPIDISDGHDFQADISDQLQTEVAVVPWNGQTLLRLSAHLYNSPSEYDQLAARLPSLF